MAEWTLARIAAIFDVPPELVIEMSRKSIVSKLEAKTVIFGTATEPDSSAFRGTISCGSTGDNPQPYTITPPDGIQGDPVWVPAQWVDPVPVIKLGFVDGVYKLVVRGQTIVEFSLVEETE